uniref:Uncharacterized protein n=1 Tax=Opuntia streptacantha TaxID=393608 RepID=A0A7C9EPW5_OPUST
MNNLTRNTILSPLFIITTITVSLLNVCSSASFADSTSKNTVLLEPPASRPPPSSSDSTTLHRQYDHYSHLHLPSNYLYPPNSICLHFHRHLFCRHHSPPSTTVIDRRYGVEKRLVPSGPNPLHNR